MPLAAALNDAQTPVERVRDRLLRAVLEHRLPPGAKLTEEEVALVCDTSRSVVRAAFQALAHTGIVRLERNRGAFVANPDPAEAREIFEARALLEPAAAGWAAERARPADIARLTDHTRREHAALAAGDLGRAVSLSGEFHNIIADIAAHRTVAALIAGLTARSSLAIALYWRRRATICEHHAHDALLRALAAGDAAAARAAMHSHLTDLLSGLDLTSRPGERVDLALALGSAP